MLQAKEYGFKEGDLFFCKFHRCQMLKAACVARQVEVIEWRGGRTGLARRKKLRWPDCQGCGQGQEIKGGLEKIKES